MGKKKRNHPDLEETLARPWCYYCERDFDDLKILIDHQRAKHFKCERCTRRLNTAGGLNVHMSQVHKEQLSLIENALPNRSGIEVEIFGMEGIPPDVAESHRNRVLTLFAQNAAERQLQTGNPAPGSSVAKKLKVESADEMKARLAAHKAKMEAAKKAAEDGEAEKEKMETEQKAIQDLRDAVQQSEALSGGGNPSRAPLIFPGPAQAMNQFGGALMPIGNQMYGQQPGAPCGANGLGQFGSFQQHQQQLPQQYLPQGFTPNAQSPYNAPNALPSRPSFASPVNIFNGTPAPVPTPIPQHQTQSTPVSLPTDPPPAAAPTAKKGKKDKDAIKMVYDDNETSPEEKMARLSKYKFDRDAAIGESSLGDGGNMAMAGKEVVAHEGGFPNQD